METVASYPKYDQEAGFLLRRGNLSALASQVLSLVHFSLPQAAISTRKVASGVQTLINK